MDAFFAFLWGRPKPYQTERPPPTATVADTPRDSIPLEEDLAIRALLPEWRPKRGRRKAEDLETADADGNAVKRQNVRASSADFSNMFDEQYSAAPSSALPWSAQPTTADAWTAAQVAIAPKTPSSTQTPSSGQLSAARANQGSSWRYNNNNTTTINETPSTPYPQSAITPRQNYLSSPKIDEPKSAHPSTTSKSPSRARKRHAPAVSSAWPSTANGTTAKIRGRPPSNRSVQDGPFSTFPANPTSRDAQVVVSGGPVISTNSSTPAPDSQSNGGLSQSLSPNPPAPTLLHATPSSTASPQPLQQTRKPSKLQLQVPQNPSGPIRLATPPRVLINGESNVGGVNGVGGIGDSRSSSSSNNSHHNLPPTTTTQNRERGSSADFFNQIDEMSDDGGGGGVGIVGVSGGGGGEDAFIVGTTASSSGGVIVGGGGTAGGGSDDGEGTREDWKRRALVLRRKLAEKEEELRSVKRRVLEAVM